MLSVYLRKTLGHFLYERFVCLLLAFSFLVLLFISETPYCEILSINSVQISVVHNFQTTFNQKYNYYEIVVRENKILLQIFANKSETLVNKPGCLYGSDLDIWLINLIVCLVLLQEMNKV